MCQQVSQHAKDLADWHKILPLDAKNQEIRLLILKQQDTLAGGVRAALQHDMIKISLSDPSRPAFKALSYVWNDPYLENLSSISEEVTKDERLLAFWKRNENAIEALTWLSTEQDLVIWVDAFCINQKDDDEKGNQVAMMSLIYQQAEEVVGWLGHPDTDYLQGFDVFHSLADFSEKNATESWFRWYYREPGYQNSANYWVKDASGQKISLGELYLRSMQESFPSWFDNKDQNEEGLIKNFEKLALATCT